MFDVTIVMPVYNEAECISDVLNDWTAELDRLKINYRLLVLNDGSRDNTADVLEQSELSPRIEVVNKPNSGHGPTILQGYREAVENADWVFQVDSDNEMEACHFGKVWDARNNAEAVIGIRAGRLQPLPRKIMSAVSRTIVSVFYGSGIADVNCPYRLVKSEVLKKFLPKIPEDTFAPNVAVSGLLILHNYSVRNVPIPHNDRQTGEVSIKKWKLWKAAIKSCAQTVMVRFKN
jgi:dolichol-phosphate mannosyltransferase